ncbi:MAG: PEGA domain-containing protein, partial [Planctomycetota bacterium]
MLTVPQRRFFVVAYSVLGAVFVVALMGVMLRGAPTEATRPPIDRHEPDDTPTAKPVILLKTDPADVVAAVMVDGRHQGQTPPGGHALTLSGLAPGTYVLKLQADGYEDWLKEVQLDDQPLELTARLVPQTPAALAVTSTPAHAEVFVDGVPRGRTPLELGDLRPGSATVRLELEGYLN